MMGFVNAILSTFLWAATDATQQPIPTDASPSAGWIATLVAISGTSGVLLKALADYLFSMWKTTHDDTAKTADKDGDGIRAEYISFINQLQSQISQLQTQVASIQSNHQREWRELMQQHTKCQAENAAMSERVKALESQVAELKTEVSEYKTRLENQESKVVG